MTNVSKRKLKKDIYFKIHDRFADFIIKLQDQKSSEAFLYKLLTKAERIMLAKRLAIVFMLTNNYSFLHIERVLKVSPPTIVRQWKRLKSGALDYIKAEFLKEKNQGSFLDFLEALLQAGLPPRGRGRWGWFYEMKRKDERKRKTRRDSG